MILTTSDQVVLDPNALSTFSTCSASLAAVALDFDGVGGEAVSS